MLNSQKEPAHMSPLPRDTSPVAPHLPTFSSIFCQNCLQSMMTMMATRMKMIATRHPIKIRVLLSSILSVGSAQRRRQQEPITLACGESPCPFPSSDESPHSAQGDVFFNALP